MIEVESSGTLSALGSVSEQSFIACFRLEGSGEFSTLDVKEATLVAYEQAIQLAPYEAILHLHRGHALAQLGRLTEAQGAYEEAQRLGLES